MISAVLMASGFSRRFGSSNKLLEDIHGKSVVAKAFEAIVMSKVDELIVVYADDEVRDEIERHLRNMESKARVSVISFIMNDSPHVGQSRSVVIGAENASESAKGIMYFAADQVRLSSKTIDRIVSVFENDITRIVTSSCEGKPSLPVIFPESLRKGLMLLEGDTGGREIIASNLNIRINVEIGCDEAFDIDTLDDIIRVRKNKAGE